MHVLFHVCRQWVIHSTQTNTHTRVKHNDHMTLKARSRDLLERQVLSLQLIPVAPPTAQSMWPWAVSAW